MGDTLPAVDLGTGRTATAITAGGCHTCALLDNGTVKCWGDNDAGQLGLGDTDQPRRRPRRDGRQPPRRRPRHRTHRHRHHRRRLTTPARSSTTAPSSAGATTSSASSASATPATAATTPARWATTSPPSTSAPAAPPPPSPPACTHTCALLDNGTVKCWGTTASAQLGLGDTSNRGDGAGEMGDNLPAVDLGTGRTATAITAGLRPHLRPPRQRHRQVLGRQRPRAARPAATPPTAATPPARWATALPPSTSAPAAPPPPSPPAATTPAPSSTTAPSSAGGTTSAASSASDDTRRRRRPRRDGRQPPPDQPRHRPHRDRDRRGDEHTCALLDNDTVKCWGLNALGSLGHGDTNNRGDNAGEMGDALAAVVLHNSLSVVPTDAAPAAPSGVTATAGPQSATLVWSAPGDDGGRPIIGYRIESSTDGVSWATVVADTTSTATTHTVVGLTIGVGVRFRVAAINTVGVSPPTLPTAAVTPGTDVVSLTRRDCWTHAHRTRPSTGRAPAQASREPVRSPRSKSPDAAAYPQAPWPPC